MRCFLFTALAACGSVDGKTPDAAVTMIDAMADGAGSGSDAACDVSKPFGTPALVPGVNTTDQGGQQRFGYLSADELTIYFSDIPNANRNIFVATRASSSDSFGAAQLLTTVNTTAQDEHPVVTADSLLLIADTTSFNGTYDIGFATRGNPAGNFSALTTLANVNSASSSETDGFISFDGLTLVIASNRTNNEYALYMSTRATTSTSFSTPAVIAELNDASATDSGGVLSADKLEIFFFSDRANGLGQSDVWRATRSSATAPFGTPTNVGELSSPNVDLPSWLSPDRCKILFSSDRLGTYDIYMATRPK